MDISRYTYRKHRLGCLEILFDETEIVGTVERIVGSNNRPTRMWGYVYVNESFPNGRLVTNNSWITANRAVDALISRHHKNRK